MGHRLQSGHGFRRRRSRKHMSWKDLAADRRRPPGLRRQARRRVCRHRCQGRFQKRQKNDLTTTTRAEGRSGRSRRHCPLWGRAVQGRPRSLPGPPRRRRGPAGRPRTVPRRPPGRTGPGWAGRRQGPRPWRRPRSGCRRSVPTPALWSRGRLASPAAGGHGCLLLVGSIAKSGTVHSGTTGRGDPRGSRPD